jgi:hypothetical protein
MKLMVDVSEVQFTVGRPFVPKTDQAGAQRTEKGTGRPLHVCSAGRDRWDWGGDDQRHGGGGDSATVDPRSVGDARESGSDSVGQEQHKLGSGRIPRHFDYPAGCVQADRVVLTLAGRKSVTREGIWTGMTSIDALHLSVADSVSLTELHDTWLQLFHRRNKAA